MTHPRSNPEKKKDPKTSGDVHLTALRCEYLANPVGIDTLKPRLSWEIVSTKRGTMQTACQVVAAETADDLISMRNLLWDTGKVKSDRSILCQYEGPALQSKRRYHWRVRIWDESDTPTQWSDVAFWEMGLLKSSDWAAKWIEPTQRPVTKEKPITLFEAVVPVPDDFVRNYEDLNPCPMLRKTFHVEKKEIKWARIYATAHGLYSLALNGTPVGDCQFTPDATAYDKYLQYQTYDVTDRIISGSNAIGAILADGWYAGRIGLPGESCQYGDTLALLMQLEIEYIDGTRQTIVSDNDFKSATGPWIFSDIFIGEKYDARMEKKDWTTAGYDDSTWQKVNLCDYGFTNLVAQYGEPVKAVQEIKSARVIKTPKGETVVDLGQNIAGRVRMRVSGPAGTEISLEHSETLDENGNFFMNMLGRNKDQKDFYILKGEGEEIWEPRFTFHGFRYIKVTGYPGEIKTDAFTGIVLSSDLSVTGSFECSDPRINRLQANILWSQRGNMLSIPTDCPQRERAGWTGDAQVFAPTACFNMDMAAFFTRWLRNLRLEQRADGQIPHVVPNWKSMDSLAGGDPRMLDASAGWGDACIMVPWAVYEAYGDLRVLEENYESMVKWMVYVEKAASEMPEGVSEMTPERRERQKYLWNTGYHFGDWLIPSIMSQTGNPMETAMKTKELVSTCFYALSTGLLSNISGLLGKKDKETYYKVLNQKIRKAFSDEYLREDGRLQAHFQGIYVLALAMDMVPDPMRAKVLDQLVRMIEENGNRLDTGFVSVPYLLDVLSSGGRRDVAYRLLFQTECPSWLYEVEKGATTMWESWDCIKPDGKVSLQSFNHYAFGCVGSWLYRRVAGIWKDQPGYKHIVIKPEPEKRLSFARAAYHSVYGEIVSDWKSEQGRMTVIIKIPANTTASVWLPQAEMKNVLEGGKKIRKGREILLKEQIGDNVRVEVGAGEYVFEYPCL